MRIVPVLGWLVVAAAIFLVTGELLTRAFDMVDRLNGYSRLLFAPGPHPDLPYRLRPGVETRWAGIDVRVNTLGLRGPEVERRPAGGRRRIVMLGDSVVFGQGLDEPDTVSRRLEDRLRDATPGTEWEVLNAGVQGYDAVAAARALELVALPLAPAAVVVGTSLNDYDPMPGYHPVGVLARGDAPSEWGVLEHSEFVLLLRWLAAYAQGRLLHQMLADAEPSAGGAPAGTAGLDAAVERLHRDYYRAPHPETWARLRAAFAELARTASTDEIPLLVAIFPEGWQMRPDADLEPQRRLLAVCEDVALRCLDLHPAFVAAGDELFIDTQHPNAVGHAIAAEAIARALLALPGVVPVTADGSRGGRGSSRSLDRASTVPRRHARRP